MEILYCRAFAQEFGIVTDAEVNPGLLPGELFQGGITTCASCRGKMVLRMTTVWRVSWS